jgi:hypothetical protein
MNRLPSQTAKEDVSDVLGRWAWLLVLLGLIVCGATCFLLPGCTVRPKVVHNSQASFDGNAQTSSLLGYDALGNRIITPHGRDRYNELMDHYGKTWNVHPGEGLTPTSTNTFLLDAQHTFYFETAQRWRANGK